MHARSGQPYARAGGASEGELLSEVLHLDTRAKVRGTKITDQCRAEKARGKKQLIALPVSTSRAEGRQAKGWVSHDHMIICNSFLPCV